MHEMRRLLILLESAAEAKTVSVQSLPHASQFDIAENLIADVPALRDESPDRFPGKGYFDFVDMPPVILRRVDPRVLYAQFAQQNRGVSDRAVADYTKMVRQGVEFDPVLVAGERFIDGGHRVVAYIKAGRTSIPVVDISALLAYDWADALGLDMEWERALP